MNSFTGDRTVAFIVNASAGRQIADQVGHMLNAAQRRRYQILTVFRDDAHDGVHDGMSSHDFLRITGKVIAGVRQEMYSKPGVTFIWVSRANRERPFFHQHVTERGSNGYCVFPYAAHLSDEYLFHWLNAFMVHLMYLKELPKAMRKHEAQSAFCLHAEIRNCDGLPANLMLNDICYDCFRQTASTLKGDHAFYLLTDFLEANRPNLLQRTKLEVTPQHGSLKITDPRFDIVFPALGNRKVAFTPLEKVVYFLFLRVPEGIHLSDIALYQEWMKFIYSRMAISRSKLQINKHIRALCDSSDNSISEKISRIRLKLEAVGGKAFANRFCIKGNRGGVKRIQIDRAAVATDIGASIIFSHTAEKTG